MKIAVRDEQNGEWRRISSAGIQDDSDLKDLLRQLPELLSETGLDSDAPGLRVCISRSLASGARKDTGLLGIDEDGNITIIQCKILLDSTGRREIVGQALEYAADLWKMSYEDFDKAVTLSEGKSLIDLMREKAANEDWSEEEFRNTVSHSLRQGRFRLIVAVQKLTEELVRTIEFLNARGLFSFDAYAVEIQRFTDGKIDIIIPRAMDFTDAQKNALVPGRGEDALDEQAATDSTEPVIAQLGDSPKRNNQQKEELFFAKCKENAGENAFAMIKRVYEFSTKTADDIIWWGSDGAGAFNFSLTDDGLTVFIVDANGRMMFNFSEWQGNRLYEDLLPKFLEKLKGIKILKQRKED